MTNKEFLKRFALEVAPKCTRDQLMDFVDSLWQEEANYLYSHNEEINGIYPMPNYLPSMDGEDVWPDTRAFIEL